MKNNLQFILIMVVILSISLWAQYRGSKDPYYNQYFGPTDMRVHLFGNQLTIDFITATGNLIGYGHSPKNESDRRQIEETYYKMQNYYKMIGISRDGYCNFQELDLDNPFFSFYMNQYELEVNDKYERDGIKTMNRNLYNRYNNRKIHTERKGALMNKGGVIVNPYFNYTGSMSLPHLQVNKYQSDQQNQIRVKDKYLKKSRFYFGEEGITEREVMERQNYEFIYNLDKDKSMDSYQNGSSKQEYLPRNQDNNYERPQNGYNQEQSIVNGDNNNNYERPQNSYNQEQSVVNGDNNNNYEQLQNSYGQEQSVVNGNNNNYRIAQKGLNQNYYGEQTPTETDITIVFNCGEPYRLGYIDFRGFFKAFPNIETIRTQVVAEEGQYYIELDRRNSIVYLR